MEILRKIIAETLVPANLHKVKQVENFIVSILRRTNQRLVIDTNLEKFQKNLFNVIDSFSVLWKRLDNFKKSPDETVTFPLDCFHTLS